MRSGLAGLDDSRSERGRIGVAGFGVAGFEEIRMLTSGFPRHWFSASLCGDPRTSCESPRAREFACRKSAADAGLAARAWYAETEDRVSVTDFVETGMWAGEVSHG